LAFPVLCKALLTAQRSDKSITKQNMLVTELEAVGKSIEDKFPCKRWIASRNKM
jgi:hypothetical protein